MSISRSRPFEILAMIKAATARNDPSYKLKKRGLLNAHDMKRLIPSRERLIFGQDDTTFGIDDGPITVEIRSRSPWLLTEEELKYIRNDIINTTDTIKHLKG